MRSFIFLLLLLPSAVKAQGELYTYYHGGTSGAWLELSELMQGQDYFGGSKRFEIEVTGGHYQSFGKRVYMIDARDGLRITAYDLNVNETMDWQEVKIYDTGDSNSSTEKYIVGIKVKEGNWKSMCFRAKSYKSGKWLTINTKEEPIHLPDCTPSVKWIYQSFSNQSIVFGGKVTAQEIKITSSPEADFVFEDNYQLRPLEEVSNFISANKHLPEIPSAQAMEKDGVDLAKLSIQLLQKIEELTLYTLEQEELLKEQQKDLQIKNNQIESLEERLSKIEKLL